MDGFGPVLSDITAAEVERAPESVRALHNEVAAIGDGRISDG